MFTFELSGEELRKRITFVLCPRDDNLLLFKLSKVVAENPSFISR